MVSNRITCMDFYLNLFSASIAMAGFIAVFLVFRYQTIDIYVDNRKKVLRSLLKKEIKDNPYIAVEVQDIGKKPEVDYIKLFLQFTNKTNKNAVSRFVDDILKFRRRRTCTVYLGLSSIVIWALLSLYYLILPYVFNSTGCMRLHAIGFFIVSIAFTMYFIFQSIYTK